MRYNLNKTGKTRSPFTFLHEDLVFCPEKIEFLSSNNVKSVENNDFVYWMTKGTALRCFIKEEDAGR